MSGVKSTKLIAATDESPKYTLDDILVKVGMHTGYNFIVCFEMFFFFINVALADSYASFAHGGGGRWGTALINKAIKLVQTG